jgi:hypothetical protein
MIYEGGKSLAARFAPEKNAPSAARVGDDQLTIVALPDQITR